MFRLLTNKQPNIANIALKVAILLTLGNPNIKKSVWYNNKKIKNSFARNVYLYKKKYRYRKITNIF